MLMVIIATIEIALRWFCRNSAGLEIGHTSLKSLDLDSLREVKSGHVIVIRNSDLCYASDIQWGQLITGSNDKYGVHDNRNRTLCGKCLSVCVLFILFRITAKGQY